MSQPFMSREDRIAARQRGTGTSRLGNVQFTFQIPASAIPPPPEPVQHPVATLEPPPTVPEEQAEPTLAATRVQDEGRGTSSRTLTPVGLAASEDPPLPERLSQSGTRSRTGTPASEHGSVHSDSLSIGKRKRETPSMVAQSTPIPEDLESVQANAQVEELNSTPQQARDFLVPSSSPAAFSSPITPTPAARRIDSTRSIQPSPDKFLSPESGPRAKMHYRRRSSLRFEDFASSPVYRPSRLGQTSYTALDLEAEDDAIEEKEKGEETIGIDSGESEQEEEEETIEIDSGESEQEEEGETNQFLNKTIIEIDSGEGEEEEEENENIGEEQIQEEITSQRIQDEQDEINRLNRKRRKLNSSQARTDDRDRDPKSTKPKKAKPKSGPSIPITSYRLPKLHSISSNNLKIPNAPTLNPLSTVAQIFHETLNIVLTNPALTPVEKSAISAYHDELSIHLIELSDLLDLNFVLQKRTKQVRRRKNELIEELLSIRKQREMVGVEMDRIRKEHETGKKDMERLRSVAGVFEEVKGTKELAEFRKVDDGEEGLIGLEGLVNSLRGKVTGASGREDGGGDEEMLNDGMSTGGLLERVKSFNAFLEKAERVIREKNAQRK